MDIAPFVSFLAPLARVTALDDASPVLPCATVPSACVLDAAFPAPFALIAARDLVIEGLHGTSL